MIVTISGRPGSGKSVVAKSVARELAMGHVSAGDFMREIAAERGMSILELSRVAEADPAIDLEIDARTRRLAESGTDFVMDARLGWHFIPSSFKVFLEVELEVAAERVFGAGRGAEHENTDFDATREAIRMRTESERTRYLDYYGLDYTKHSHYDLVVDTSHLTVGDVVAEVSGAVRLRRSG